MYKFILLCCLILSTCTTVFAGDIKAEITPSLGNVFRSHSWLEVVADISGLTDKSTAILSAVERGGDKEYFSCTRDVPQGDSNTRFLLNIPQGNVDLQLQIFNSQNKLLHTQKYTTLIPFQHQIPLFVSVEAQKQVDYPAAPITFLNVLPESPLGYQSIDILFINQDNSAVDLSSLQIKALIKWLNSRGILLTSSKKIYNDLLSILNQPEFSYIKISPEQHFILPEKPFPIERRIGRGRLILLNDNSPNSELVAQKLTKTITPQLSSDSISSFKGNKERYGVLSRNIESLVPDPKNLYRYLIIWAVALLACGVFFKGKNTRVLISMLIVSLSLIVLMPQMKNHTKNFATAIIFNATENAASALKEKIIIINPLTDNDIIDFKYTTLPPAFLPYSQEEAEQIKVSITPNDDNLSAGGVLRISGNTQRNKPLLFSIKENIERQHEISSYEKTPIKNTTSSNRTFSVRSVFAELFNSYNKENLLLETKTSWLRSTKKNDLGAYLIERNPKDFTAEE